MPPHSSASSILLGSRVFIVINLVSFAFTAPLPGASPREVESRPSPVRDHHLFVGVDLFLQYENRKVEVLKIEGDDAFLATPTPLSQPLHKMRGLQMDLTTKVSDTAATINGLKTKRTYSPRADPIMKQMTNQMQVQMAMEDQADIGQRVQSELSEKVEQANNLANTSRDPQVRAEAESQANQLTAELNEVSNDVYLAESILDATLFDIDGESGDDEGGRYDAVEVSFKVSSPHPMAKAYVVVLVRIEHEHDLRDVSFYKHIGKLDSTPRPVSVGHLGLPPGFIVKDTRIFLFNYGEEIPTNLSEKHYELTAEEAREFAMLDRQGTHRRDSVPAQPAWEFAPRVLQASSNPRDYDFPVTVELDATGKLVSIHSQRIVVPDHIREVIEKTTFLPALEKGTPVASTLQVNPKHFFKE